jgi:structure-specific endonuclease subunit SLX1
MVCSHPYNIWPLRIKLFTPEASRVWDVTVRTGVKEGTELPRSFNVVKEFEGVDGKSGQIGSGRSGPIDVQDGMTHTFLLYDSHSILDRGLH